MPRGPAFTVEGADESAKALRAAGKEGKKRVRKAGKAVGELVVSKGRARTRQSGDRMQRAAVRGLRPSGTLKGGAVRITNTARVPFALAAFMGVKGRRGWYAHPRFDGGPDQFPPWIGNNWRAGTPRGGPYFVNYAIYRHRDELAVLFTEEIERAFRDLGLDPDN